MLRRIDRARHPRTTESAPPRNEVGRFCRPEHLVHGECDTIVIPCHRHDQIVRIGAGIRPHVTARKINTVWMQQIAVGFDRYAASMLLSESPAWSKRQLGRLGRALVEDSTPPENCPTYDDVIIWHHELAATIAEEIACHDWTSCTGIDLEVSSRGKTIDTLIQKLRRSPTISLDQVQDLAGVRVDALMTLRQQTALAHELAEHFDVQERGHRDLRTNPHSGYRAYHLWLRLPAGRAEIQIRTEGQSAWANTYERMGDAFGRGIRYGELPENEDALRIVEAMHSMSELLTRIESERDELSRSSEIQEVLDVAPDPSALVGLRITLANIEGHRRQLDELHGDYVDHMSRLRRMIESLEEVS